MLELIKLDIYKYEYTKFFCTATIPRLSPSQRWWFFSCNVCHRSSIPYGVVYRYRICYIGTDGQDEIEFVFFDRVGREIVGKPLISILRSGHSSNTPLEDIVNSTSGDASIPMELAAVVSTKFRFVVQMTSKSFEVETNKPSYQVHRIDTNFGRQVQSPALHCKSALAFASPSKPSSSRFSLPPGSSHGCQSPSSSTTTLDAPRVLADSTETNAMYMLATQMTPPSINKLPNPRSRPIPSKPDMRRGLFQEPEDHGHTREVNKDSTAGLYASSTIQTDGTTVEPALASSALQDFSSSSQILDRLESATDKLQPLPTVKAVLTTQPEPKDLAEDKLSPRLIDATKLTLPPEILNDKRRWLPSIKAAASGLAKNGNP